MAFNVNWFFAILKALGVAAQAAAKVDEVHKSGDNAATAVAAAGALADVADVIQQHINDKPAQQ